MFQDGIEQVVGETGIHRAVLMCTERDPLECHRTRLAASALASWGIGIEHILAAVGLESHAAPPWTG